MKQLFCSGAPLMVMYSSPSQSQAAYTTVKRKAVMDPSPRRMPALAAVSQTAVPREGERKGAGAGINTPAALMLTAPDYAASEQKATIKEDALLSLWLVQNKMRPGVSQLRMSMAGIDCLAGSSGIFRVAVVLNVYVWKTRV